VNRRTLERKDYQNVHQHHTQGAEREQAPPHKASGRVVGTPESDGGVPVAGYAVVGLGSGAVPPATGCPPTKVPCGERSEPHDGRIQSTSERHTTSLDTTGTSCTADQKSQTAQKLRAAVDQGLVPVAGARLWLEPGGAAHLECGPCGAEHFNAYDDPPWAHKFREEVAAALHPTWPSRAAALRGCGKAAIHLQCRWCSTEHYKPARCAARTCPICSRIAAALLVARIVERITDHDKIIQGSKWEGPGKSRKRGWKLLTLTLRAVQDVQARFNATTLRAQVQLISRLYREFWRRTHWGRQIRDSYNKRKRARRDTSYVVAIEVSPEGVVHLHALVFGEYVFQADLSALWQKVTGSSYVVDIRAVHGVGPGATAGALREVLKYATKGEKGDPRQAEHAAAVEYAFKDTHRVRMGGAIRSVRIGDAFEDAHPVDLSTQVLNTDGEERISPAACQVCGAEGPWHFLGFVGPRVVAENGGFGLVRPRGGPFREPRIRGEGLVVKLADTPENGCETPVENSAESRNLGEKASGNPMGTKLSATPRTPAAGEGGEVSGRHDYGSPRFTLPPEPSR
jgi:Replication protein